MRLREWREMNGKTQDWVAEQLTAMFRDDGKRVAHSTVVRWERGQRVPSTAMMRRIGRLTRGAVTPNDFIDPT